MSTAFYPQGMESYNNNLNSKSYVTWKGAGSLSNPVAITAGNIRPFTNKDSTNVAYYPGTQDVSVYPRLRNGKKSGARPMKWQYRKGTTTQPTIEKIITTPSSSYINTDGHPVYLPEHSYYDVNHISNNERTGTLIGQTIDRPGQFSVKQNVIGEIDENQQANIDCQKCKGVGLVADYYPQKYLTDNPNPLGKPNENVECASLCCNQERKALKMVLPANTNLPKTYFTTLQQYRQNRCQTYDQRAFNFQAPEYDYLTNKLGFTKEQIMNAKPGSPLSLFNLYVANCYPNTDNLFEDPQTGAPIFDMKTGKPILPVGPTNPRSCKLVVYKPSNPQFAVQGGVSSSTRTLKLTVDTVNKNINSIRGQKGYSGSANTPFIYKNKVAPCTLNNGTCNKLSNDPQELLYRYAVKKGYSPTYADLTSYSSVNGK